MENCYEILEINGLKAKLCSVNYESGEECYGAKIYRNNVFYNLVPFGLRTKAVLEKYVLKKLKESKHFDLGKDRFVVNDCIYINPIINQD